MTDFGSVPLWLAVLIAFFVMLGATLTLIGALGFVRLERFYDRLHAPTLGTSWGTCGVIVASMLLASHFQNRVILHEILIGLAVLSTVPVTLMLLGRAALHRDRTEGSSDVSAVLRVERDGRAHLIEEEQQADDADAQADEDYTPGDDYDAPEGEDQSEGLGEDGGEAAEDKSATGGKVTDPPAA